MGKLHAALLIVSLLLTIGALAVVENNAGAEEGSRAGLFIQLDDGMLTVKASEVPHREILEGLARTLGFDLVVAGPLDTPRSLDLQGKLWEEVLKKALSPASWTFVYGDAPGSSRPVKVVVFPPRAEDGSPSSGLPTASIHAPAKRPFRVDSQLSPTQRKDELPALQEQLVKALDARDQLSALHAIATRGGPEDLVQALSQLSGQPEDIRELRNALEGQTEDVRQAIQEMLGAIAQEP